MPDKKDKHDVDPDKKETHDVDPDKKDKRDVDPDKKDKHDVDPDKKDKHDVDPDKKETHDVDPDKKETHDVDPDKKETHDVDPDKKETHDVDPDKKETHDVDPDKKETHDVDPDKKETHDVDPDKKETHDVDPDKKETHDVDPDKKDKHDVDPDKKDKHDVDPDKKETHDVDPDKKETHDVDPDKKETHDVDPDKKETHDVDPDKKETHDVDPDKKETHDVDPDKKETHDVDPDKKETHDVDPDKKETHDVDPDKKDKHDVDPDKKETHDVDPDKKDKRDVDPDKKETHDVDPDKKETHDVDPDKKETHDVDPDKKETHDVDPDKKETHDVDPDKKETHDVDPDKKETHDVDPDKKETHDVDPDKKETHDVDPDKKDKHDVDPDKKETHDVDPDKKDKRDVDPDKKETHDVDPDKKETHDVDPDKKETHDVDPDKKETHDVDPDKKETHDVNPDKKETHDVDPDKKEKHDVDPDKKETHDVDPDKKDKDDVDSDTDRDVDGGYAWVILAGCFLSYMFVIGTVKAYGVLYTEIVSTYGSGTGSTAWIGSAMLLGTLGLSPIANMLSKKYTFRRVAFVGGLLITLGYFLSGFVDKIEMLFLTFGLCGGIGYGMSFSPCSTIISYYFKKHRALANSIVVSASGVGAICFPFVYKYLISEYGLKGTFWIVGAILSYTCVAACLFRQPRLLVELQKRHLLEQHSRHGNDEEGQTKSSLSCSSCTIPDCGLKFSLLKNPSFTMHLIALMFCMNGFGNNFILIPSQIKALGYSSFHIALGVTIMGALEVISRIIFGWFAYLKLVKTKHTFLVCMLVSVVISFIAPFLTTFEMMAVYAGMVGAFPGSMFSQLPVMLIDVVGMEDFPSAFGLVMLSLAFGSLISQPTIGWLQDSTGNWTASFILTGCSFLCSALIIALESRVTKACTNTNLDLRDSDVSDAEEEECLPLQDKHEMTVNGDTESPLVDETFYDKFTSPRISRIYRPCNSPHKTNHEPSSPVPVADTQDV